MRGPPSFSADWKRLRGHCRGKDAETIAPIPECHELDLRQQEVEEERPASRKCRYSVHRTDNVCGIDDDHAVEDTMRDRYAAVAWWLYTTTTEELDASYRYTKPE